MTENRRQRELYPQYPEIARAIYEFSQNAGTPAQIDPKQAS
jgi:hypothetical protein